MTFSQISMGKKQDSMVYETAISYGLIPDILDPVLVGCSMSLRKLWDIFCGGLIECTYPIFADSLVESTNVQSGRARNGEQFEWPGQAWSCVRRKPPRTGTYLYIAFSYRGVPVHSDLAHRENTGPR